MRTIYLDIDGVLCVRSPDGLSIAAGQHQVPHPDCVANLNKITDATGAHIVVSSSWRKVYSLDYIKEWAKRYGVTGKFFGTTEKFDYPGVSRGKQIKDHHYLNLLGDRVLVIDDEEDAFKDHDFFYLHTRFNEGLTELQANIGIHLLSGKYDWQKYLSRGFR